MIQDSKFDMGLRIARFKGRKEGKKKSHRVFDAELITELELGQE